MMIIFTRLPLSLSIINRARGVGYPEKEDSLPPTGKNEQPTNTFYPYPE